MPGDVGVRVVDVDAVQAEVGDVQAGPLVSQESALEREERQSCIKQSRDSRLASEAEYRQRGLIRVTYLTFESRFLSAGMTSASSILFFSSPEVTSKTKTSVSPFSVMLALLRPL